MPEILTGGMAIRGNTDGSTPPVNRQINRLLMHFKPSQGGSSKQKLAVSPISIPPPFDTFMGLMTAKSCLF